MPALARLAAAVGATALAAVAVQMVGTVDAFAHENMVTGVAACQQNGTYTVTWTVKNTYADEAETATVTDHTPGASQVSPGSLALAASASGTVTQTGVPGNSTTATLAVHGVWTPDNFTQDATGTVSLDGRCGAPQQKVTPVAPTADNGACVAGETTRPSIVIPGQQGVTYSLDGRQVGAGRTAVAPGSHVVTAASSTLDLTGTLRWVFRVTSAAGDCTPTPRAVRPASPTVQQSVCTGGTPSTPSLTVPRTPGVSYTVTPAAPYRPGTTVTVTAVPTDGYRLGTLPSGWRSASGGKATFTTTFAATPTCVGVDNAGGSNPPAGTNGGGGSGGELANTGVDSTQLLLAGLAMLTAGGLLVAGTRRRPATVVADR